jgi:histidine triad (HIT) family protein
MALNPDCLFCRIIQGEIPATIVYRNEDVVAFRDINPQAPTHVIIVPTVHVENAVELATTSSALAVAVLVAADEIATMENLDGYRTVFNTGASVGQSVFHAHLHLLGGREFSWPPG